MLAAVFSVAHPLRLRTSALRMLSSSDSISEAFQLKNRLKLFMLVLRSERSRRAVRLMQCSHVNATRITTSGIYNLMTKRRNCVTASHIGGTGGAHNVTSARPADLSVTVVQVLLLLSPRFASTPKENEKHSTSEAVNVASNRTLIRIRTRSVRKLEVQVKTNSFSGGKLPKQRERNVHEKYILAICRH